MRCVHSKIHRTSGHLIVPKVRYIFPDH
jgi:hypothetical protein